MAGPITLQRLPGMGSIHRSWRITQGPSALQRGMFGATDERGRGAPPVDDKRRSVVAHPGSSAKYDTAYASRVIGQLFERIKAEEPLSAVAEAGIRILRRIRHPNAVEPLIEFYNMSDQFESIRVAIIHALGAIGSGQAVGHLVAELRKLANDPEIRGAAIEALGSADAVTALGTVLRDTALPPAIRVGAVWGLKDVTDRNAAQLLWKKAASDADPDVSGAAQEILAEPLLADLARIQFGPAKLNSCPADNMQLGAELLRAHIRADLSEQVMDDVDGHLMNCVTCARHRMKIKTEMVWEDRRDVIGAELYDAIEPLFRPE